MLLNVWTKPSGYNLGETPNVGTSIPAGNFIVGNQYVITVPGNTAWTDIGAKSSSIGTVFTATDKGLGTGVASKTTIEEHALFYESIPLNPIPGIKYTVFPLPTTNDQGVSYRVISGEFPRGLRIVGNKIVGSSFEVARDTEYVFCIRAQKNSDISDRTFKMTITGPNVPEFVTQEGDLALVTENQYWVLDKTFVDYQIEATDRDTSVGQKLSYFIAKDGGQLPPGLVLTQTGRITGFVQPVLAIREEDGDGTYDNSYYDAVAFDFANVSSNGYDTYVYDTLFYDFNLQQNRVRKLNRYYEFVVTVTDGDSISKRKFRVLVIGDDFFRADNALLQVGFQKFTADGTFLRPPVWSTPANLGYYRGNNYITVKIDTYDQENTIYDLEQVNADINCQTVQLLKTDNVVGSRSVTCKTDNTPQIGQYLTFADKFDNAASTIYQIDNVVDLTDNYFRINIFKPDDPTNINQGLDNNLDDDVKFLIGSRSKLPPGMSFDRGTAEIYGTVPYVPAITQTFTFSATATTISANNEQSSTSKKFTINIIGEIDSSLVWNSPSDLGNINANFVSTLSVSATSTIPNSTILYRIVKGKLPPGLTLNLDGEIIGMVNQFYDPQTNKSGILQFSKIGEGVNSIILNGTWSNFDPFNTKVTFSQPQLRGGYAAEGTAVFQASGATVSDAGTGYQVGNILTVSYGGQTAQFQVETLTQGGTGVATVSLVTGGEFYYTNDGARSTSVFPSGGKDCKLNVTYTIKRILVTKKGCGYTSLPTVTISDNDLGSESIGTITTTLTNESNNNKGTTTFDGGGTTIDRSFTFTVEAKDQYSILASQKEFTIEIKTPNQLTFSNLKVKTFLNLKQRSTWRDFINDTTIFTPTSIYRPNDPNFGVQQDLKILIYAGIETTEAARYVSAMGLNHKKKRLHFGSVKKAVAYEPGTKKSIYEVVYIEMIDPLEPDGKRLPNSINVRYPTSLKITTDISSAFWKRTNTEDAPTLVRPELVIDASQTGYTSSDNNPKEYFPNSISNWRDRLKKWSDVDIQGNQLSFAKERNYLPLWMRSIQPGTKIELDFQLALPLCYCKPGTADDILLNIKFSNFDFKLLDYTADRYIIDALEGSTQDKYLVFRNDRITI